MAECKDPCCPFHGTISVRGNVMKGIVKSAKAKNTIKVEKEVVVKVPKYERYKKTKIKVYAHSPSCMKIKEGDEVVVGETRKISKTKSFVVIEKVGEKPPAKANKKRKKAKK